MASFTQVIEDITPGGVGGWQEIDAGTAPNNSVAEIIAWNNADATANTVAVRDTAEAITKTLDLNKAESGGKTAVRFLINVDASGNVDLFRDSVNVGYTLLGYWEGVTWTDQWESTVLTSAEDDFWFELPAARLSLQIDRAHLITISHYDTGKEQVAGARTTGSGLVRWTAIMKAEAGGVQCMDVFVHTDAVDGNIEVWSGQYNDHTFYNQGHFDAAIVFTEGRRAISGAGVAGWIDQDLFTDRGVPKGSVVDFNVGNRQIDIELTLGVRQNGTVLERTIEIREAEGDGICSYGTSVQTDANGIIEYRRVGTGLAYYYFYAGYFNVGVGGVTETKTFTGDAVLVAREIKTFTADACLLKTESKTFNADAILVDRLSKTLTADAILVDRETKTFTADVVLSGTIEKTFTADAVLLETIDKTFTGDVVLVDREIKTYSVDAVLVDRLSKTFTADGVVVNRLTDTFTADAILSAVPTVSTQAATGIGLGVPP